MHHVRTRTAAALAACLLPLSAWADANLVPLDGSRSEFAPADFGYRVRTTKAADQATVRFELTPQAVEAFGHGELRLTRNGSPVVETDLGIVRGEAGAGVLRLTFDTRAADGGEILLWSGHIAGQPAVRNFGGFRASIPALLAGARAEGDPPPERRPVETAEAARAAFRSQIGPALEKAFSGDARRQWVERIAADDVKAWDIRRQSFAEARKRVDGSLTEREKASGDYYLHGVPDDLSRDGECWAVHHLGIRFDIGITGYVDAATGELVFVWLIPEG